MLNKKLIERLNTIKSILFKEIIAQLISLIATILRVISLRKRFILKTKILSLNLFARSLINNLIIY